MELISRFATKEEIFTEEFNSINKRLIQLNKEYNLVDHSSVNKQRFSWSDKLTETPIFYASRMWEFPFAILAAELKQGMTCADIGCGTTPFTAYLSEVAGSKNVTGFDPDYIENKNQDTHYAFGTRKEFVEKIGFNFRPDGMTKLSAPDESFDRVFCISVLEHIEELSIWQKGIKEMVRILKPGGRLIITVDLGINCPLTNPLDIIKYSGLTPTEKVDFKWPEERFVNLNGEGMDVFGLILEKTDTPIYNDYTKEKTILEYKANLRFIPKIHSTSAIQIADDYQKPFGSLRVITKLLLGKYR